MEKTNFEKELELPNTNYFEKPKNKKLKKLEGELAEKEKEIKVENFRDDVRNDPTLNDAGIITVKRSWYRFLKWAIVLLFLILLCISVGGGYLILNGHLDGLIQSSFNQTTNINNTVNNEYDIDVPVDIENQYEHEIYVNTTIYNNIIVPEE